MILGREAFRAELCNTSKYNIPAIAVGDFGGAVLVSSSSFQLPLCTVSCSDCSGNSPLSGPIARIRNLPRVRLKNPKVH